MTNKTPQHSALFRIKGWVEYKLIEEATGKVLREGTADNVYTTWGLRSAFWNQNFGSIVTLSDDEKPSGIKDGLTVFHVDGKSPTPSQTPTPSYDQTNLIVSRSASFASPSSPPRTVRKIIFGHGSATTGNVVYGATAYMEISPPIVQDSGNTLELVYRQQFLIPTAKSMKRWQMQPLKNQRRAVQGFMFNGNLGSFYSGYNIWQNHGKYFFADEGARYGIAYYGGNTGTMIGPDGWAFRTGGSGSGNVAGNSGAYASRYSYTSFATTYSGSSNMTGAFTMATAVYLGGTWNADDTFNGSTEFTNTVGIVPLAVSEGDVSTVFLHPPSETYLFNVVGSVATGQGELLVKGPYRPDDQVMPNNKSYRIQFYDSGGTDPGTEGTYKLYRSSVDTMNGTQSTADASFGMGMRQMYPTFDVAKDPDVVYTKNSCCYDGKGHYWASGRSSTESRLFMWKGFTCEQILDRLESDDTRFYGIVAGDDLVTIPWSNDSNNTYGQAKATPTLTTNGNGLVYYPTRMAASGEQAIYVIDNQKPGRYYQRPSGIVTNGSNNFEVDTSDEIHAMWPFITGSVGATGIGAGDVGKQIRIVGSTAGNDGVRTITAFVDENNVTVDGAAFTAESGLTWHWVVVTKRDVGNGITDKIRVLKYDKTNSRLWAWTDAGIQVSTDDGYTWSGIIESGTGLSTANAEKAAMPDGRHSNSNCCIGNSGELYWVDIGDGATVSSIGLNKYVGTGPGGTHTRILYSSFTNYDSDKALYCLNYDPVAPDMATTEGSLWMGTVYATSRFWRLKCDSFTQGNMDNYINPIINQHLGSGGTAGSLTQGVQCIDIGPGGLVSFNNMNNNNGNYNISFDYTGYYSPPFTTTAAYNLYSRVPGNNDANSIGWGSCDIQLDGPAEGTIVEFGNNARTSYAGHGGYQYWWEPGSSEWIIWKGTEAQFNTRYSVSNGGRKDCHATYELLKDNLRIKFLQNGAVAQTEEYKVDEAFTFISSLGVHRTNIQDLFWYQDVTLTSPKTFLEDQAIKTVPTNGGSGDVRLYWDQCKFGSYSVFDPQRPLGAGTNFLPEVEGDTGARMGQIPQAYPDFLDGQYSGYVPAANVGYTGGPYPGSQSDAGWMAGLDLSVSEPVAKLRISIYDNYWYRYGGYHAYSDINGIGRLRIYYSDDNATWTEVPEVRWIARDTNSYDTGTTASIVAGGDASHPDITGLTGFTSGSDLLVVGQLITITGAASSANNGTFPITQVNSATSVRILNAAAVTPDANNGAISWVRDLDPGYQYVYAEKPTNQVENGNGDSSNYTHLTFDLLGAGLSSMDRTHQYWKVIAFTRNSENGNNISSRLFKLSYFAAFGDDGYAVGIPSEAAYPEANDPNIVSTPTRQFYFIQDRVGLLGKGGIDSIPDSYADGFTDTVTISSGTFDTGSINVLTDYLAYRSPVTGTFLRNDTGQVASGHPAALGQQTQVRITSVSSTQIVVSKRNIPDNLSGADWEVRRAGVDKVSWTQNAGDFVGPYGGAGYLKFNEADAGREFRLVQRTVSYRP